MIKRGLVLGGGGTRGAYQVGVWQALRELNIDIHIVTGTSIGAMNGALFVQDEYDTCLKLWNDIKFEMMVSSITSESFATFQNLGSTIKMFFSELVTSGGLDIKALENTINNILDEEKIRNSDIEFGLVTVQLPKLTQVAISKSDIPSGKMADYLVASAACFPAFKSKDIDNAKYIDGGYRNNLPMDLAVDLGANEIIAVDLEGFVFNNIPKVEGIPIRYIRCQWDLGLFLHVDKNVISRNIKLGYLDTMRSYGVLEGHAYAFELGECEKLYNTFKKDIQYYENALEIGVQRIPTSPAEKLARYRIINTLNRRPKARVNMPLYIQRSAEIAAELMDVAPDIVYTNESINKAILTKFDEQVKFSFTHIEKALETPKSVAETAKLLAKFEKKELTSYIYSVIDKVMKKKGGGRWIKALAGISTKEFIGALYIFFLKNSQQLISD